MGEAVIYAEQRWGSKSRAALITKAGVPGLGTGTVAGTALSDLAGARTEFFEAVRAASIIGRLPLRRVGFRVRQLILDEGPVVQWRAEGAAYGNSPLKVTSQDGLARYNVGSLIVVSREMLEDQSVETESIIRNELIRSLAAALDAAFIDPANSGATGKPASVTNAASGPDSPAEALFDWGDTYTGDVANSWIVMNPFQAARLSSAARPNIGAQGVTSWAGFPVITSTACPEGIFVFLDPGQIAIAIGDADVRSSENAFVDMQDSSSMTSGPSVAASTGVSMFQVNAAAIVGSVSANWRLLRAESVQVFDAQAYGLSGGL
jgi:hypothetical protein